MQLIGKSGETFAGIAVVFAIAIPFGLCYAGPEPDVTLDLPASEVSIEQGLLWFPLPACTDARIEVASGHETARGSLIKSAYIRDQRVGLFRLDKDLKPEGEVTLQAFFEGASGEMLADTGPLSGMLSRALAGYGVPARTMLANGTGTVGRAHNLAECAAVSPDILLVCGHALISSGYVDSLALMWAVRMGLNVAVIDVADISVTSPVMLRDFIRSLYDSRCAGHYGDGHLGFVVLLGDAYEDDNTTRMVPDYDGYGGDYEASDHYYACLSGDDDFEDVMLGRIPAGNVAELVAYYRKVYAYSPLPAEEWTKALLLIGGCYFAYKDDYVDLFDQYQSYVPDDFGVSRLYRYDYPLNSTGDALACQAVIDSLNKGFLFALYSGDGDRWDWGPAKERAFRSSYIPSLANGARLPIVLSIACSNGWFDNRTAPYIDGGMDCFAERIVLAPGRGAVACVASSRETGGTATTVFAHEILKSAFQNGSTLLGELMVEAKTRHLLNLGSVSFVRQFNVLGDPCLNFLSNQLPTASPDVAIRPYHVRLEPSFAVQGSDLTVEGEIWNASGVALDWTDVGLYSGWPDSGGVLLNSRTFPDFYPWEKRAFSFAVSGQAAGNITLCLKADVSEALAEADEDNNLAGVSTYVYPCESGFPLKMADIVRGQVAADLDGDGRLEILVTSGGSTAQAVDLEGNTLWSRHDLGLTQWFDGVEPAAADLNGDGTTECIIPIKAGLVVADGITGVNKWKVYTDYPCLSPVVTDLEGDGSFEILLGTYSFTYSRIWAYNSSGSLLWLHDVPGAGAKLTGIVVCDADLDGDREVIYSTTLGRLTCLECGVQPPAVAWQTQLSTSAISSIVGGDLERDGSIEVVANHDSVMSVVDAIGGGLEDRITVGDVQCLWNLSLADVDRDGVLEILCGSSCGEIAVIDEGLITLHMYVEGTPFRAPVVADVDGDGSHEIIFALSEGWLKVVNLDGTDEIPPLPTRGSCAVTPIADNIDDDPNVEVVISSSTDSTLFVLDMATGGGIVEWSYAGCSSYRTNLYAQPLFGELSDDLMLTGRVNVVGDVLVDSGATLTLERYTDMLFLDDAVSPLGSVAGRCEILVDGRLIVRGTQGGRARVRPADYPPGKNAWQGIIFRPGSCGSLTLAQIEGAVSAVEFQTSEGVISECLVKNSSTGIKVTDASPLIDSNHLIGCDYGISSSGGSPLIVNNDVTLSLYNGMIISGASGAVIETNRVSGTIQGNGIAIYSSAPSLSRGNRFEDNSASGIYLSSSSPAIDSCWISNSGDCGIKAAYYANPVISRTSLVGNKIGLGSYISSRPVLGDTATGQGGLNDIRDNTSYAVYNRTPYPVKAQGNWWGTDEPGPSLFYGQTDYSGWLVEPPAGVGDGPGAQALVQAVRPNPFSESIRLSLAVSPEDLPVAVAIFDVRGRLVRKIRSQDAVGVVDLEWDGLDAFGCQTASGAYFVSVTSRRGVETRKVILLR